MIKNIVFDLGNVLVKADFSMFRDNLYANGITEEVFLDVFAKNNKMQAQFESGIMSKEDFVNTCISSFPVAISKEVFVDCFNGMFDEITEMKNFLVDLAKSGKYNLYLLSNTNPIHFEYILEEYDYVNLIQNFMLSYKLGCIKPDSYIYEKVIRENNLIPDETIFIDDLTENCVAAERLGIKAIHYTDFDSFYSKFNLLTANY